MIYFWEKKLEFQEKKKLIFFNLPLALFCLLCSEYGNQRASACLILTLLPSYRQQKKRRKKRTPTSPTNNLSHFDARLIKCFDLNCLLFLFTTCLFLCGKIRKLFRFLAHFWKKIAAFSFVKSAVCMLVSQSVCQSVPNLGIWDRDNEASQSRDCGFFAIDCRLIGTVV